MSSNDLNIRSLLYDMDKDEIRCGFCGKPMLDTLKMLCSVECDLKAEQEIDEHQQGDWDDV